MLAEVLFPGVAGVRVNHLWREGATLHVVATTTRTRARCPDCGRDSRRVHSRYDRVLADVPCVGSGVRLHVRPRRFWCRVRWCRRRIFCERLPGLAEPRARRTARLLEHLRRVAGALGGEAACRAVAADGTPVSARTLLRLLRSTPLPPVGQVRILGVDDWSRRRGQAFGTILVDLEDHRVLDLLPDRTAATLAAWLAQHPEVEVVSRDRAGAYAQGVRQGAPQAIQVADRFHLVANLTTVVERTLGRHHAALRTAAQAAVAATTESLARTAPPSSPPPPAPMTKLHQEQLARRARRQARSQDVLELHRHGRSQVQIAGALGMGRHTVRRILRAGGVPEMAPAVPRPSGVRPYEPYLRERWAAGCDNAMQLWREVQERGYPGSASNLRQLLAKWRRAPGRPGKRGPRCDGPGEQEAGHEPPPPPVRLYSPRRTTWLLLREPAALTDDEWAYVIQLRATCPALARLQALASAFHDLVREHDVAALPRWLERADESEIPEVKGFADGLRADRAAVEAGLTLPWSQGQVEGQVNRLKLLKRAGYGRSNLDLLRLRLVRAV
jgi:transposase